MNLIHDKCAAIASSFFVEELQSRCLLKSKQARGLVKSSPPFHSVLDKEKCRRNTHSQCVITLTHSSLSSRHILRSAPLCTISLSDSSFCSLSTCRTLLPSVSSLSLSVSCISILSTQTTNRSLQYLFLMRMNLFLMRMNLHRTSCRLTPSSLYHHLMQINTVSIIRRPTSSSSTLGAAAEPSMCHTQMHLHTKSTALRIIRLTQAYLFSVLDHILSLSLIRRNRQSNSLRSVLIALPCCDPSHCGRSHLEIS